ncbi:MAG TPA: hypothetical protein VJ851_11660 [Jatrophihabitans sp.]|nr:hypothetical protein [Jatrophihabitans sp.]
MVSSAIYGPQAIGVVIGLVALSPITSARARYLLLAVAVAVLVWPFAGGYREAEPAARVPRSACARCWVGAGRPRRTSAGPSAAGCW